MNRITMIIVFGLALAAASPGAPANALNVRSYVASYGNNANTCSLSAPCRTLQIALDATAVGGEITILDAAGYNGYATVNITKAISIVNQGGFQAGIGVAPGQTGIVIDAGASDAVSLRGLTIEGAGLGANGIQFNTGKSLTVENCVIRHMAYSSGDTGIGVLFAPAATSSLSVSNALVADNGLYGIVVKPSGSGAVTAVFNRVQANNNTFHGIAIDGEFSTGTVQASVYDTVATGNADVGFFAYTVAGKAATTLMVFHSVAANNLYGLEAHGTGAILRVAHSMVTGNASGWLATINGVVLSDGDNTIEGNMSAETAPPTYARK